MCLTFTDLSYIAKQAELQHLVLHMLRLLRGIIPERERIARKEWMTEEILTVMDERRQKRGKNENRCSDLDRTIKRECTKAKENGWMRTVKR